jgi:hypothetical protein
MGTFPKEIRQLVKARLVFSGLVENELGKFICHSSSVFTPNPFFPNLLSKNV